eukprot:9471840-Pyramimonas_sp.AAC.2
MAMDNTVSAMRARGGGGDEHGDEDEDTGRGWLVAYQRPSHGPHLSIAACALGPQGRVALLRWIKQPFHSRHPSRNDDNPS